MAATQPRRRRCKNITTTELPVDVIFNNILPRLPARYVMKYLCVSKEWYSFLKSPMFANMHLNHATNDDHQNHHKLLVLYKKGSKRGSKKGRLSYSNRDCETQKPGMRRRRPLPFGYSSGDISIISSCNGLVLVAIRNIYNAVLSDLIIWNPLTNDYKTLSKTNLRIVYYNTRFELYYISSEQDYRVLLITVENAEPLWSMEKIGVWEEASTYNYTQVQGIAYYSFMEPLHLMRDRNWLMKSGGSHKCYYKVDL
ncbi:putative F-box domain-containing protein [Tanacetum coccineum]